MEWRQIGGSAAEQVVFSNPSSFNVTFVTPPVTGGKDATTLFFELVARDNLGGVGTDRVQVTVKDNGVTGVPDDLVPVRSATRAETPVGFDVRDGKVVSLAPKEAPLNERATQKDRPKNIPYGLFDFTVKVEKEGDSTTVRIWFPEDVSDGFSWYKYDSATETWKVYPNVEFKGHEAFVTLTDGGEGDVDGEKNGFIHDPSGPGSEIAKTKTRIEGSSGGGALGGVIVLVAAGLGLRRRERRVA